MGSPHACATPSTRSSRATAYGSLVRGRPAGVPLRRTRSTSSEKLPPRQHPLRSPEAPASARSPRRPLLLCRRFGVVASWGCLASLLYMLSRGGIGESEGKYNVHVHRGEAIYSVFLFVLVNTLYFV